MAKKNNKNPFDEFVLQARNEVDVNSVPHRMKEARRIAELQRAFTIRTLIQQKEKDDEIIQPEVAKKPIYDGMGLRIWRIFILSVWGILSISSMYGNFIGGIIVATITFPIAVFIVGLPSTLNGITESGHTNNTAV